MGRRNQISYLMTGVNDLSLDTFVSTMKHWQLDDLFFLINFLADLKSSDGS